MLRQQAASQRLITPYAAQAIVVGRSRRSTALVIRCEAVAPPKAAHTAEQFEPQVCAILGTQWGDEGKGKLVDILAQQYDIVARAQGGANAGHTIYDDEGNKYALHLIPSGILNRKAFCVVGNGVVVHLPTFLKEIREFSSKGVDLTGRLLLSDRAHVLFDLHKEVDGLREAELAGNKIGTTKRGIGPAYASKSTRNGVRVGDILDHEALGEKLRGLHSDFSKRFGDDLAHYDVEAELESYLEITNLVTPYIADTSYFLNRSIDDGKRVLIEGGQAALLDIDFGTYPFVTSSNPTIGGIFSGLGLPPRKLNAIIGVAKAYTTRVGAGPYPTEIFGDLGENVRAIGREYGTTTGRPRRVGWMDVVALNYAIMLNGFDYLNLTKLDVLSELDEIKIGVAYKTPDGTLLPTVPADLSVLESVEVLYETLPGWRKDISKARTWDELPPNAKAYVQRIEELTGVLCKWIGVGPGRDAIITQPDTAAVPARK